MEITYERKHNESYMVLDGVEKEDSYESKMIESNNIFALLPMTRFAIDGREKISYKISRKENLEDFVESHDLTVEVLERLLINLQLALDELSKYLIDERHIWLSKESIFVEKSNENYRVSLCYYPSDFGTVQQQFREVMEYFMSAISQDDRQGARQVYMAYDLCLKEDYTLNELVECLQDREVEKKEIYVEQVSMDDDDYSYEVSDAQYLGELYDEPQEKMGIKESLAYFFQKIVNKRAEEDFVQEPVSDFEIDPEYEMEERTVLLTESKPVGKLVYDGSSNEDDFIINKDIFRIGSGKNNDAILKAKTVSTNHAKITKEGEDYYISDSNSLNGSFLNSTPLIYRKPYKLKPMDIIRFAGESYVFM